MKIQLPNGEQLTLDEHISLEEKLQIVKDLSEEFMPLLKLNWHSNSVKYFLDTLANYIVWHKEPEEKGTEDKEILSRKKMEKLVKFKKTSKTTNFTDLSETLKESLLGESRGGER